MSDAFYERVYRGLLALYPREHRREYGELMVQLFRDRMRRDGKGFAGLTVWIHLIVDLFGSAAREHTEGVDMKSRTRVGIALAGVVVAGGIGAGVLLANSDGEPSVALSWQQADTSADGEPGVALSWTWSEAGAITASEPSASVSWHEAGAFADGKPRVSESRLLAGGTAVSAPWAGSDGAPRVSLSWQQTDAVAQGEPKISLSWEKADQIAPE